MIRKAAFLILFTFPQAVLSNGLMGLDPEPDGFLESLKPVSLTRNVFVPRAVDLSSEMPPPREQIHGSCVSYTVAYATLGYYLAQRAGATPGDPAFTPSPAYLHTQIHNRDEPCQVSGANISAAMKYLADTDIPAQSMVGDSDICSPQLSSIAAPPLHDELTDFKYIYTKQGEDRAMPSDAMTMARQALASGYPLPAAFSLYCERGSKPGEQCIDTLSRLKPGQTFYGSDTSSDLLAGGHAMAVVGYDDEKQAFKIQNSWGQDFADGGFFWMDYTSFRNDVRYVLKPQFQSPPLKPNRPKPFNLGNVDIGDCFGLSKKDGVVSGFVETHADRETVLDALNATNTKIGTIDVRPWPVCAALSTLQEPLLSDWKPSIRKLDGRLRVSYGASLAFEVTTGRYPSFLYLVYLQADGSVVNLAPRGGFTRRQHQPDMSVIFGDGKAGRQTYTAAQPSGPEAVIAISSRAPIFELEELENTHTGQYHISGTLARGADGATPEDQVFLSILSEALGALPEAGNIKRSISADVLHITVEK